MRNQVARQRFFGKVFDMTQAADRKSGITTVDTRHLGTDLSADASPMKPLQARLKDLQLRRATATGEARSAAGLPATRVLPKPSAVAADALSLSELGRGATRPGEMGKSLDIENLQTLQRERPTSLKEFNHDRKFLSADIDRKRRHSYAGPAPPPREFFCPMSKCLMTEPVTLLNTGVTLSRTSLQTWLRTGSRACPVTGKELSGWVAMESNEKLRKRIQAWATEQGLNFELLDTAAALLQEMCGSNSTEDEVVLSL